MTSSLQPATLVLSYDSESINEHIQDFIDYLKSTLEENWMDRVAEFDFFDPEYPELFPLAINGMQANAGVVEVCNKRGFVANVAICHARSAIGQSFFFLLEKDANNYWRPATSVLPMAWEEFIQLSKAEQYTALNC